MKNLVITCAALFLAIAPFSAAAADRVLVRSGGKDSPMLMQALTQNQQARIQRLEALLRLPAADRPQASRRVLEHPAMRGVVASQPGAQAIDVDCTYDEAGAAGCWVNGTFCGIVWDGQVEIGCW